MDQPTTHNQTPHHIYFYPPTQNTSISSFNILPVHETLITPTRDRMRLVLGVSGACTLMMYLAIAAFGYMYALDGTLVRKQSRVVVCMEWYASSSFLMPAEPRVFFFVGLHLQTSDHPPKNMAGQYPWKFSLIRRPPRAGARRAGRHIILLPPHPHFAHARGTSVGLVGVDGERGGVHVCGSFNRRQYIHTQTQTTHTHTQVCIELLEKLYRWADRLPLLQPLLHLTRRPLSSSFPNTAAAPLPPMTGIEYVLGAQGPRLVVVGEGAGEEGEEGGGGGEERQPLLVAGAAGGGCVRIKACGKGSHRSDHTFKHTHARTHIYSQPPLPAASAVATAAAGAAKPEPIFYASTGRNQPLLPPQVMPPAPAVVGGVGGDAVDTEDYEISRCVCVLLWGGGRNH